MSTATLEEIAELRRLCTDYDLDVTASSFVDSDPYRFRLFEFDDSGSGNVRVDEVGIWSRALSATEVSELYNNGAGKLL